MHTPSPTSSKARLHDSLPNATCLLPTGAYAPYDLGLKDLAANALGGEKLLHSLCTQRSGWGTCMRSQPKI